MALGRMSTCSMMWDDGDDVRSSLAQNSCDLSEKKIGTRQIVTLVTYLHLGGPILWVGRRKL